MFCFGRQELMYEIKKYDQKYSFFEYDYMLREN